MGWWHDRACYDVINNMYFTIQNLMLYEFCKRLYKEFFMSMYFHAYCTSTFRPVRCSLQGGFYSPKLKQPVSLPSVLPKLVLKSKFKVQSKIFCSLLLKIVDLSVRNRSCFEPPEPPPSARAWHLKLYFALSLFTFMSKCWLCKIPETF